MRAEPRKGSLGSTRQEEKESGSEQENARRDEHREDGEARGETAGSDAGGGDHVAMHGPPDFGAGKGGDGEDQIKGQEEKEIKVAGEDGGGEQFEKRDDCGVEVVAIGTCGENLHYGQEEE